MHTLSGYPQTLFLLITVLCSSLTVRSWDPVGDAVGSAKDTVGSALNETTSFAGNINKRTTNAYNYTKGAAEDAANGSPAFLAAGQGSLALVSAVLIGLYVLL